MLTDFKHIKFLRFSDCKQKVLKMIYDITQQQILLHMKTMSTKILDAVLPVVFPNFGLKIIV